MSATSLYLLVLGWGLAGGFSHCIGMCGIFVISYTGLPDKGAKRRFLHPERHALFHGGRLLSLMLLGLLGGAVGDLTSRWQAVQQVVSIAGGILMIGLALGFAGTLPQLRLPEPDVLGAGGGTLRRLFVRVLQSRHGLKAAMIGVFVGLLPCGLTYYALLQAALTHSPAQGALTMLLFGLGTIPGLLTLGLFGNALFGGLLTSLRFRRAMTQVAAAIMAITGLVFIGRGLPHF